MKRILLGLVVGLVLLEAGRRLDRPTSDAAAAGLAAYNAGDYRVTDWQAAGPYSGIDEFVESIPFTQTRDYVQAILRNEETYRAIDSFARAQGEAATAASR